jgi:glucose-1-phosphate thymidylyltransferase
MVEKSSQFLSNWAVIWLYYYDNALLEIAAGPRPSTKGELETMDINWHYLGLKKLRVDKLVRRGSLPGPPGKLEDTLKLTES